MTPALDQSDYTYTTADHDGSVTVDCDWGGPCDYWAVCSCGWLGTRFSDVQNLDGTGTLGTRTDALRELLVHAGFDVDAHRAAVDNQITTLLGEVTERLAAIDSLRTHTDLLITAFTKEN